MCTALSFGGFFGRNLDLERSFGERVVVTPRNFALPLRALPPMPQHYAMVGTACVQRGFPLYFDAVNERGLAMAGLDFPGCAVYRPCLSQADNVTPFELIPWVLGRCATLEDARIALRRVSILDEAFSPDLPLTPMHWLIADRTGAIAVEPTADGLRVLEDPAGVLTNSPGLEYHMTHLSQFLNLTAAPPENRFAPALPLHPFSRGMGAMGLPGDPSSPSRFVRAAFYRACSKQEESAEGELTQCMHLLTAAAVPRGSVVLENGETPMTMYTACCDLDRGIYCFSTYENRRVSAVSLHREKLDGTCLTAYDMRKRQDIAYLN